MSDKAQSFANSKRNKMKGAQKAAGVATRGPNMGKSAKRAPAPAPRDSSTAKPNVYTNKYKQGIADQMMPTDGNGNFRPSRALAMRNYYQNNVISNAFGGKN